MRYHSESAPRSSTSPNWQTRLLQGVVCAGCLIAGAALVGVASPRTWLAAGASQAASSGNDTVLLDFTATWCGPCQQMSPIVERLAQQGYPVKKVDVDQQRAIAERFRITSMPTFVLLVNGREVMRQVGATSEEQLRRMLLQIPAWQQELASQERQQSRGRELAVTNASATEEFGPSPFAIDLGTAEPVAQAPQPDTRKRGFALPFFQRDQPAPQVARTDAAPAVVRGQAPEGELKVTRPAHGDPMLASVRLRVKDSAGMNFGSGTVLESRIGRTLILTCGHIFRNLDDKGLVEVDVFPRGQKPLKYVGTVVHFDPDTDVGLVAIPTSERLAAVSLSSIDQSLQVGDSLLSIGCGGGEIPSRETVEVTAVNRYTGPDNIECTSLPVQGRSGGGLFRGKELVGVCIAADPKENRGVYTALSPIYEILEQSGFTHLLPVGRPATAPVIASAVEDVSAFGTAEPPAGAERGALPGVVDLGATVAEAALGEALTGAANAANPAGAADLQAVLGQAPDSEIICIVRPKNPKIPSRVVIIHEATPKLVSYLLDSVGDLPDKPGSLNNLLSRTDALVPTSGMEIAQPSPFFSAAEFPQRAPGEFTKPMRPASPR